MRILILPCKIRFFIVNLQSLLNEIKSTLINTPENHMRFWYLPLNIKYFDFVKNFHDSDTIDVRQYSNYKFAVGDVVYIYSGEPFSQFMYVTEIVETDIPFEQAALRNELRPEPQKSTVNNWMRLKVLQSIPPGIKSLQGAIFTANGFWVGNVPHLIKESDCLIYLDQEFDKYNCE